MQNTSTATAHERLAHAQNKLTEAEQAWAAIKRDGCEDATIQQDAYSEVQRYQADVVLWQRVIENADEWTYAEIIEREG